MSNPASRRSKPREWRCPQARCPAAPWGLPKLTAQYDVLLLALILLAGILAYANSFSSDLLSEARTMLQGDPRLHDLDHLDDIFGKNYGYPLVTNDGLYRPLTTLSFLLNYTLLGNGTDPVGYHTLNWLLHVLNSILVFYLVTVVFRSTRAGFVAGILFACQPANTEAVTCVLGRPDLLSTTFVLLGFFAHLGDVASGDRAALKWLLRLTTWLLFFLALMAKESAFVLLPLIVLFDWLFDWRRYSGHPTRDFWGKRLAEIPQQLPLDVRDLVRLSGHAAGGVAAAGANTDKLCRQPHWRSPTSSTGC